MTLPAELESLWPWLAAGSTVLSIALLIASVFGLPWVLCNLPVDVLHRAPEPARGWRRFALNAVGAILVVLGILMLVLPGQGLLTVLAGLVLLEVPGRHRVVVWSLQKAPVRRAVDGIRTRRGHPPLQ